MQRARAESATQEAIAQRQRASEQAQRAQQRLVALYTEEGRRELLQGSTLRAVVYLSEAYKGGETGPTLRMLLADAMRPVDAQLVSLTGHVSTVFSAQFSSDGTRVVTASADKTAKIWAVRPMGAC